MTAPELRGMVFVKYIDHVVYNRAVALDVQPQIREAVGWLIYECDQYVTIKYDRDADAPTLKGGDAKASGLCLLKSSILEMKKLV